LHRVLIHQLSVIASSRCVMIDSRWSSGMVRCCTWRTRRCFVGCHGRSCC